MRLAFIVDSVPFTAPIIAGDTSLGGSESACLGLARELVTRGHDVSVFTTKLDPTCHGTVDAGGVTWWDYATFEQTNQFIEYDVVIALRVFAAFGRKPINARLRLLWNQDLLVPGNMQTHVMAIAWALDQAVYVSQYHQAQWEQAQPELKGIGWVTRNGYDPKHLPATSTKFPNRIIHISRPERGLRPLLEMWPALKAAKPDAELHICRYSSMYDTGKGSWSEVCQSFDDAITDLNATVGGITYLGELNKPQLYQAISDAAVMWYPGVSSFAETSCIAAIEAQACGTPFVGSYRGALPETVPGGVLVTGLETSPEYRTASVNAVLDALEGCKNNSFSYRQQVKAGKAHVKSYTYEVLAAEWEQQIEAWFKERYEGNKIGVLRQLLHEDDHTSALELARSICDDAQELRNVAAQNGERRGHVVNLIGHLDPKKPEAGLCDPAFRCETCEAFRAIDLCKSVIAGKEHTAEDYGTYSLSDVLGEARTAGRFKMCAGAYEGRANVLDIACGNGSFAIACAWANPTTTIHGLDYSAANIEKARAAAIEAGVSDRVTFDVLTIYDFDTHELATEMQAWLVEHQGQFDGLFVGEFIEHVAGYQAVIDGLELALSPGAAVVYTCPHGAYQEIAAIGERLRRSHVHRYHYDDVQAVWKQKQDLKGVYLAQGMTPRGTDLGSWIISYTYQPGRQACRRDASRIARTRPMPRLTVGIIAKDAANDIGRCLTSVCRVADRIIVGDTGSRDRTKQIAKDFGADVFDLVPVDQQPEGFAGARNQVLAKADGEWFLWIDADEQLINGAWLRTYLENKVFNGFVIRQTHLYTDGAPTHDIPIRLFRQRKDIQFYGCVHEQPQMGDANGDIMPTLDVGNITVAHWGYLTAGIREEKRTKRNLPLLMKDQQVFPDRLLGKVLCVREAVLQADALREAAGGEVTDGAREGYLFAVKIHIDHFDDPAHKYHGISRPWYETALQHLDIGFQFEIGMAGKQGALGQTRAKPERLWVRDGDEYTRIMTWKTAAVAKDLKPPTMVTDPRELPALSHAEPVGVPA